MYYQNFAWLKIITLINAFVLRGKQTISHVNNSDNKCLNVLLWDRVIKSQCWGGGGGGGGGGGYWWVYHDCWSIVEFFGEEKIARENPQIYVGVVH